MRVVLLRFSGLADSKTRIDVFTPVRIEIGERFAQGKLGKAEVRDRSS